METEEPMKHPTKKKDEALAALEHHGAEQRPFSTLPEERPIETILRLIGKVNRLEERLVKVEYELVKDKPVPEMEKPKIVAARQIPRKQ